MTIFDPFELREVVKPHLGLPITELVPKLVADLQAGYPGAIDPDPEWVLNNAGGAMGTMLLLHASFREYLIIFGTPIGTDGHSGRFRADDWFIILDGEQWAYQDGALEREVYRPGDIHHLPRGTVKGYRVPDRCWALEYARGAIPAMLPFGLADTLTSTLDLTTLARTFRIYGKNVIRSLRSPR